MKLLQRNIFLTILLCAGCAYSPKPHPEAQRGDSVVCIGEEPAHLAHLPLPRYPVTVRSTYERQSEAITYVEGRDYTLDWTNGSLRRLPGSRIPDFRTNVLYGQPSFDHSRFPGYGNGRFFVFVDYSHDNVPRWPAQPPQTQFLTTTQEKLRGGRSVKIVAFGDSITAGGEATKPALIFWQRWADELQKKYPQANITAVNGATGGDTTVQGLQRLQAKVIDQNPDLVVIGFGMNDNNIGSVPLPQFKENLKAIVAKIRAANHADIVLYSAFPPNPQWKFGSRHMADYAQATKEAAAETDSAYADVFDNWQSIAARKKPEDMLGNNINHPNDFGHWVYYRVLCDLGL